LENRDNILLTGSTGTLGKALIKKLSNKNIFRPGREDFDITNAHSVKNYFLEKNFNTVIHCAAMARMSECENNPREALWTNLIGTAFLVDEMLMIPKEKRPRFIHISTDGVYPSTEGFYSEKAATIPYNKYGWTKLGAESAVNMLSNFCIIRTRFFDPGNSKFKESASDIYTSSIAIDLLCEAIIILMRSDYQGTINIGGERLSDFERTKKYDPTIKPCVREDIVKNLSYELARDSSLDCSRWNQLQKKMVISKTYES
jgi:dTDP-4-dehydrorhamnose reductase